MRILHVIPAMSASDGGPLTAMLLMEQALVRQGVTIVIATTVKKSSLHEGFDDLAVNASGLSRIVSFPRWTRFYKISPALAWWLYRNIETFDVVHIHALFSFSSIVAGWIAGIKSIPYVIRPLGTLNRFGLTERRPLLKKISLRFLEIPLLKNAAAINMTSDLEKNEAAWLGVPLRSEIIPLGMDFPESSQRPSTADLPPVLVGKKYLLFLSRLDPVKNIEALLLAFSQILPANPDVYLVIAGSGEPGYERSLKNLAAQLAVSDNIVWTGFVKGGIKASLLDNACLFVLPSYSESFGIAAMEALANGLPCVLGNNVAIATRVLQAGAGVVVSTDAASIARELADLLNDPGRRALMAQRALNLSRSDYSLDALGLALVQLYKNVVAGTIEFDC